MDKDFTLPLLLQHGFHKIVPTHASFTQLSILLFLPLFTLWQSTRFTGIRYYSFRF
nr:MAG TPA: hypothetical protein [Caudoviricetes sp.]